MKLRVYRSISGLLSGIKLSPYCFLLLLMFAEMPLTLLAQGTTGSIIGVVTDVSGAFVEAANVTVREVDTNQTRIVQTSANGTYVVPQLKPGLYSVAVEKAGFKTITQTGIRLVIDQTATINTQLSIGEQAVSVDVTDSLPVIQTEDSSIGLVVDSNAIQNTPLNGRLSLMGLIALAPGVQGVGAQDQLAKRGLTYSVGSGSGRSTGSLGSTLDGIINTDIIIQRAEPEVPSLDAISQFKVLTNGAPAEFGQPSQLIVVTASGTNKYHGGLLWFNRSKGTAAKPYFNGSSPRAPYQRNEFGGNFSGPIVIPHLYNGRDRSFFFVSDEAFRLTQSASKSSQQPTQLMRSGVFTEFAQQVIDPATGLPFPNHTIPASRINPVTSRLLSLLYPLPTQGGTGTNTYELVPYTSVANRFSLRVDHRFSDKDQIRGTVMLAHYGPSPTVGATSLQGGYSGDGERNHLFIVGWTHTFSPTMLLDTSASYQHLPIFRTPQNYQTKWESIVPGLSSQIIEGAPQIGITNITSVGESGSKDLIQGAQYATSLTKVFTHHTVKAGFNYLYDTDWNASASTPARGQYNFNGQYSQGGQSSSSGAPWAFADFLLGLPSTTSQGSSGTVVTRNMTQQWGAYVQDDWKLTPRLTINVGLRYDLQWFGPGYEDQAALFVPSLKKVVVFGNSYPSTAIPYYVNYLKQFNLIALSSEVGLPSNSFSYLGRVNKNFAPRLGFAYQVTPNTVLRGASGIYYSMLGALSVGNMFGNLPFIATQTYTNSPNYSSAFSMNNPFGSAGTYSNNPSVTAQHPLVNPYTEQYNLAIEHQFAAGTALRVGYVGQHDLKANGSLKINLADPPIVGATVQSTNLIQPLAAITYSGVPLYHSTMNALQVGVHRTLRAGLVFGAEYQWSRILGTESLQNPSGSSPQDSYGPIGGIATQVLQMNYGYELPMGRGKWIGGGMSNFADKVFGNWKLSGIVSAQNGQPFSVTYTAPGSPVGQVSGRANRVPGAALYPSNKTKTQWFNPAAFTAPTCYNSVITGSATISCQAVYNAGQAAGVKTYASYGNSAYNMLRGPGFQNWDMSLQKTIKWKERYNVQLRADTFNVFNHPNFEVPNTNISNSNVGTITSTSSTPTYQQRTMEFAAKFNF
ncbi:MAG: TonB-dependent receptor [Acidobacteria bacterium]|nr:TonB-dependent receptor [Acidobacteriota bacterium]